MATNRPRYNMRSPAVRRLMREAIELKDPTPLYHAQPLEENLFEWHFTIRGPPDTDYEGGRYHGRIILPPEYPMKPPSIILTTPNGRFELYHKICLSASAYHPELWQASWGIRTMLLALIGFMPTEGHGAIGSLNCSGEERRRLAQRSLEWVCPVCEVSCRSALPDHDDTTSTATSVKEEVANIVSQMSIKTQDEVDALFKKQQETKGTPAAPETSSPVPVPSPATEPAAATRSAVETDSIETTPSTPPTQARQRIPAGSSGPSAEQQQPQQQTRIGRPVARRAEQEAETTKDRIALLVILLLVVAIIALLARRFILYH